MYTHTKKNDFKLRLLKSHKCFYAENSPHNKKNHVHHRLRRRFNIRVDNKKIRRRKNNESESEMSRVQVN